MPRANVGPFIQTGLNFAGCVLGNVFETVFLGGKKCLKKFFWLVFVNERKSAEKLRATARKRAAEPQRNEENEPEETSSKQVTGHHRFCRDFSSS